MSSTEVSIHVAGEEPRVIAGGVGLTIAVGDQRVTFLIGHAKAVSRFGTKLADELTENFLIRSFASARPGIEER